MKSVPNTQMRSAPRPARVVCPRASCGGHLLTLPPGQRVTTRADAEEMVEAECDKCGESSKIPVRADS